MKKIIFLILTLFGLSQMNAQIWTIASCSNLGTTTYGPMYSVAGANATSREAVIYPSSQLATLTGQTLNAMYFKRSTAAGSMAGTPNFKIYLKEVSNSDWGAAAIDWATETTGATLVYDSDPASIVGSAAGWLSFPLSTNFVYSGTQNLAVFFEYQNTTASTSISWNYEYTAPCSNTTNNNTTKYSNNTTGTFPASLASANYRRPLIGFDFVVSCPAPTLLTATNVTTNSVDLNWIAGASETQWEYAIVPASASNPTSGVISSVDTVTDSSLSPATAYKAYVRAVCGAGDNSFWVGPVNFTTACVPITTLPWSENFDTLTAGTNVFPPCWAYTNTTSTWSISTTPVANSGANSLRRTWSTDGWAFTPPATLTAGTSYTLSYFMRTNDTVVGYDLTVGVGNAQTEIDMTTNLSTVTGYQGPTWTKFTHEFTPSTTGDYSFGIHVVAPNAPNGINFDDFKLDLTPSCVEPTLLVASAVTSSTATVSWTESLSSPANGYEYYVSTTNVAPLSTDTATGSVAAGIATVDLSTLNPSTTYYVWVRSACSSTDKSAWSTSTSFTTACVALTTLPWTENFDALTAGTNIFPSCWAYTNTTSTWSISTTPVAYSGSKSLRRTWSTNGWAYTPMATLTAGTSYTFSYYMRTNDAIVGYDLTIGVGNGQSEADMITTLSTVTGYQGPTWTKFTHEFTPSTSGDYSFGIHVVAPNAPNGINFDDFKLDLTPNCLEPTLLVTSAVTSSSATISWTEPNIAASNGYEYIVSTTNTAPLATDTPTGAVAAGIATVDLTSLLPATTYYVWVRSVCSATDKSTWSSSTTFITSCVAVTTFTENFDSAVAFPACWARVGTGGNTYVQASTTAPSLPNNLYLYGTSATSQGLVMMPPVSNAGAGTHQLKFKARANFTVGGVIEVGYLTDIADATTFVSLQSFTTTSTTVYNNFVAILGTDPGANEHLAFRHLGTPANSVLIDNVSWEAIPSCVEPNLLVASAITSSTATVSWTESISSPANGYEYILSTTNTTPLATDVATGSVAAGIATVDLLTLTPSTTYYVWVRSNCSASDKSSWSSPVTFTTACVALTTLPWTENFDALTTGTNIFPSCWAYLNTTSTWTIDATNVTAYSGANSLRRSWSTDGWAYTPMATLTAGTSYTFSYYMRTKDTTVGYDLTIGVGNGQSAVDMTTTLSTTTGYQNPTWTKFTFEFTPTTTGDYSFGVHVVAPVAPNGINFDDFKLELSPSVIPTCATNIIATPNATCGNFATTITWDAVADSTGYNLTIGTTTGASDILNNVNIGANTTYSFIGNIATTYYFKLTPFNGVGPATGCVESSFVTASNGCYCPSLPTSNDGSGITNIQLATIDYPIADVTYVDNTATVVDLAQGANTNLQISFATGFTYGTNVWIDFDNNFTFDSSEIVYTGTSLSTNPTILDASFLMPATATLGQHTMRIGTADSGQVPPNPCFSGTYGVTVDYMVNIIAPPTCEAPMSLVTSNVTTTTATVSWTASTSTPANGYEYYVSTTNTAPDANTIATGTVGAGMTMIDLINLSPVTTYYVWVRSLCSSALASSWSVSTTFATLALPTCEAPLSLVSSNVTINTAAVSWTASTSTPANGYEYYVSTTNTDPSANTIATGTVGAGMTMIDLINLSPATTYYVWVRSLCSSTLSSSWSVSTTFVTLALPTCEAPMSLVSSNVTINTAAVSWIASTSTPANGYEYYVSTTNTDPNANTIATGTVGAGMTMVDLINLSPATTYYIWVRSLCSGTLSSTWSISTTFTTLVAPTPPVNDDCSGAIVLTPAGDFATAVQTGTLFAATASNFIPTCQTSVSSDVWYTVVVPTSGNITIETQNAIANSMTNSVIAAFTGACNTFVQVGCNDDNGTNAMSLLTLTAQTPGATLYIGVWNNGNPTTVSNSEFKIAAYDASLAYDTFNNNSFSYFPNPVKDVLNLSYSKNITNVAVYNLLGQQVIVKTVNANQSQIDMSKLSEGTYMVKITADNQVKTIKVMKQ